MFPINPPNIEGFFAGIREGRFCGSRLEDLFAAAAFFNVLTGGWILLSMTVYFWSLDAEKESVVPALTFSATFRGTLSKTGLLPGFLADLTRIETWSVEGFPELEEDGLEPFDEGLLPLVGELGWSCMSF